MKSIEKEVIAPASEVCCSRLFEVMVAASVVAIVTDCENEFIRKLAVLRAAKLKVVVGSVVGGFSTLFTRKSMLSPAAIDVTVRNVRVK